MNRKQKPIPESVTAALLAALILAIAALVILGGVVLWRIFASPTAASPAPGTAALPPSASALSPSASPSATPTATPSQTPAEAEVSAQKAAAATRDLQAKAILDGMTLHEKVCQLFIVYPEDITGVPVVTAAGETTQQALAQYPVGGFLYRRQNLNSRAQVQSMLRGVQEAAKIPLLLTVDEEGGRVNRLMSTLGTTWVGPMLDYRDRGAGVAYSNAATIAADLRDCGFNADLAPVADVRSNPENSVIGDRAYSDDFKTASELVFAAVTGFHAGGVAATLKHFPGHGDTTADSHDGAVTVTKTLAELRAAELLPFAAGIEAGADAVMIGHLTVPDIDSVPAPFSAKIVTELLRKELGFDGVVMTDGLQMKAMTDRYSSAEIAVSAVNAGVDMLLCPLDAMSGIRALTEAVTSGALTQERLDESVLRILTFKLKNEILPEPGL